jgi:hypothetical protein
VVGEEVGEGFCAGCSRVKFTDGDGLSGKTVVLPDFTTRPDT